MTGARIMSPRLSRPLSTTTSLSTFDPTTSQQIRILAGRDTAWTSALRPYYQLKADLNMSFNFLALPSELRVMIYHRHLAHVLNAPGWFNQQIRNMRLPIRPLAHVNQQMRAECLAYYFGQMSVEMNLAREFTFWRGWRQQVPESDVLSPLRNFVII